MKTRATVSIDEDDIEKLNQMVESGDSANVSHAVAKCVKAYPFKVKLAA